MTIWAKIRLQIFSLCLLILNFLTVNNSVERAKYYTHNAILSFLCEPLHCAHFDHSNILFGCFLYYTFLFVLLPQEGKGVAPKKDPVSTLQYLLGHLPKLNVSGHLLGVQLMSVNAYLHTSILYAQWEGWHGKPVDDPPLFYNGLTEPAADVLSSISDEIVNIARVIELKTEADLSHVRYFFKFV